ncbi:MAG: glycosyltransferase [Candidatus Omnitrophica bacterium]|nr:glycosyltransferase [Candidatus Omnitrophota bacterium]
MNNWQREFIQKYYDYHWKEPLIEYFYKNPTLEDLMKDIINFIPKNAKRILGLGCKIGWLLWEIKRHRKHSYVLGVDISQKRIDIACKLFKAPKLEFFVADIVDFDTNYNFDCIVMVDVYEHILRNLREKLHQNLKKLLKQDGILILVSPTINFDRYFVSQYLKQFKNIKEDITKSDIQKLAKDIDRDLIYFKYLNIKYPNDYFKAIIGKTDFVYLKNFFKFIRLEKEKVRRYRMISNLGFKVSKQGLLLDSKKGIKICVVTPSASSYSQTFIRNHIENLKGEVLFLHGTVFPKYDWQNKLLDNYPKNLIFKLLKIILRNLLKEIFKLNNDFFYKKALERYFIKNKVNIVLAEFGHIGVSVMDICKNLDIPLVVYFHGYDLNDYRMLKIYREKYFELFDIAKALVVASKYMKNKLINLGADDKKIFVIPYGVNTSLFSNTNPEINQPIFFAVSRFVDKKAPHLTILAFKKVLEQLPQARLIMAGDGILLEACKQLVKALKILPYVEFLNICDSFEISQILKTVRCLIQHSVTTTYNDKEGLGVVFLEALASGVPVIATKHNGIPEVVIDGKTGFLVDEFNIEAMAEKMIILAKNSLLAKEMGNAASEYVRENFSLEKSSKSLQELLEKIVKNI